MRSDSLTVLGVLLVLGLAVSNGCVSKGASPPAPNAPCQTDDGCPSGYQCLSGTTAGSGRFCCKDKDKCGPTGLGGTAGGGLDGASFAIDGVIASSPKDSASRDAVTDVASGGGSGGNGTAEAGPSGSGGSDLDTTVRDTAAPFGTGGLSGGGGAGGGLSGVPDAALDVPVASPDSQAPLGQGKACIADTDCASGACVDGVCCNKSRANCGGCNACTKALTGLDDGACGPVSVGKVAHDACTDETATKECGSDGTCDGKGACRKVSNRPPHQN